MQGHLSRLAALCQRQGGADNFRKTQNLHPGSRDYGALFLPQKGFAEPSTDCAFVGPLALYYYPQAREYQDPSLLERAVLMMDHLLENQNPDGSLDLPGDQLP